jgi:hypothetical protein
MRNQESHIVRVLNDEEEQILAAIADRIFPKTGSPGAVEIGAIDYIKIALAGDYAAHLPLYRQGLKAVQRCSRLKFRKQFVDLGDAEKDSLLCDFEAGSADHFRAAAEFFETLRYHVLEGVFCEPKYGGNKNMTGWRLVGFPGQQFGYADPYINRRVDLEPVSADDGEVKGK